MTQINKSKDTLYDKEIKQELNNFDIITEKSSKEIFSNLYDIEGILNKINDTFENIYLIDINPQNIKQYKEYAEIYKILNHYVSNNAAEHKNIQLMFLKLNKKMLNNAEKLYIKNKAIFGDMIIPYKYKYYCIVGYYGGTKGRTNQDLIEIIKSNFEVKNIQE